MSSHCSPRRLTDVAVRNLKPSSDRREIPDPGARGLYVVVQPSGQKGFCVRYRFGDRPRKLTLPAGISLAGARKLAAAAMLEVAEGCDPAAEKQRAREQARVAGKQARAAAELLLHDGVAKLVSEFIEKHAKQKTRPASWKRTEYLFKRFVLPAWHGKTVHQVTRRDIISLVETVAESTPVQANRVFAATRKFFAWCVSRDILPISPCLGVAKPAKEVVRDRVLTDPEIVELWRACDEINPRYGAFIRFLILTGQRRSECGDLPAAGEINRDTRVWTLPAARAKNHRPHTIPLSTQAWRILSNVVSTDPALVFGKLDFGRVKRELDSRLSFATPWTLHDLRRGAASGLQRVGAPVPVIEQILNHRSGVFAGIAGVYQRHSYDAEKAVALQKWGDYVERLVTGADNTNVLPMVQR
jgi:integrase